MAEGSDVEGQRMVGNAESGSDAMVARRDCDHDEGAAIYTPQGQSQPPFAMGNNSMQVNLNLLSPWVVILCRGHGHGVYVS
ncbi:hypothetical protein LOK49_Contig285G00003 [Camellia lanceoleosa]|nr:hypothetical protein LOK49_Contig285G00003 [Camellia lanceoleosa]